MTSFKEFLEEQLLDKEFATAYDEVSAEMALALALARQREKLGFTQQRLADLTGIRQPMIARIEGGQMPNPRTLQRLAKALRVGVLFTGEGIMLVPLTESKSAPHYQPAQDAARAQNLWAIPTQKIASKRQKLECDYTLLGQMKERQKMGQTWKQKNRNQKEQPNAGLEIAA